MANSASTKNELTRSLFKNSAIMLVARMLGLTTTIAVVPVLISVLGKPGYGVWEAILAVAGIAVVIQTVISGTLLWRISHCFGAGEHHEAQRLVGIGVTSSLMMLAAMFPSLWLLREQLATQLSIPSSMFSDAAFLLPTTVAVMLLGGVNHTTMAFLTGYQRAGMAAIMQTLSIVVTSLVSMLMVSLGFGLTSLLWGLSLGLTSSFVLGMVLVRSTCGHVSYMPQIPTRKDLRLLLPFASLLLLSNATMLGRDHADKVLLASIDSPTATANFGIAQRLTMLVMQVVSVLYFPLTAAIGAMHGRGDWQGIRNLYRQSQMWFGTLVGMIVFLICCLRRPLFVLWLGEPMPAVDAYLGWLMIGVVAAVSLGGAGVAFAKGVGKPGYETVYAAISFALLVPMKIVGIWSFGNSGMVAASAISWAIGAWFLCHMIRKHLKMPASWLDERNLLLTLLTVAIGWWGGQFLPVANTRWQAFAMILGYGLLLSTAYFLFGLATNTQLRSSIHSLTFQRSDRFASAHVTSTISH